MQAPIHDINTGQVVFLEVQELGTRTNYYRQRPAHKLTRKLARDCGGERTAPGWPIVVIVERSPTTITVVDRNQIEWINHPNMELKPGAILYTFSHDLWLANSFYHYN